VLAGDLETIPAGVEDAVLDLIVNGVVAPRPANAAPADGGFRRTAAALRNADRRDPVGSDDHAPAAMPATAEGEA